MSHYPGISVLMLTTLLLAACSSNVEVKGQVPTPLSKQLPAAANLYLDKDFLAYTHNDKREKKITLAIGPAQGDMFRTVCKSLFTRIKDVSEMPASTAADTLTLHPTVEEIQLATPFDNHLKVFEVWIRYDLQVFDGQGKLLADWIMTAYGKTPTRFLGSDEEALNQATMVALRDAGARLTLELPRLPAVKAWLRQRAGNEGES